MDFTDLQQQALRRKIAKKLKGFSELFPANANVWKMHSRRLDNSEFPVPDLVLLLLRNIMGYRWTEGGEKICWTVYASFLDEPIVFQLGKWGFDVRWNQGAETNHERMIGQLKSALRQLEVELESYAKQQVIEGRVTLANHCAEFEARYKFFRGLAKKAYLKSRRVSAKAKRDGPLLLNLSSVLNKTLVADREGFFHSAAMVDAYFSYLEHRLILLRAFTGKALANGEFKAILLARWDEKIKMVVPDPQSRSTELLISKLRGIKERIRNPFAHGGVENDGGSLFFHMPTLGAIPLNLSKVKNSVRFNVGFIPISSDSHEAICKTFDEIDSFLKSSRMGGPYQLLEAGVDPSFDPESLSEYAAAVSGGREPLDAYIDRWGHDWEKHANFES